MTVSCGWKWKQARLEVNKGRLEEAFGQQTLFFSQSLQGTWRPQVTSLEYSLLSSVCYLSPVFLGSRRQLCPQCFMGRFQQKPLNLRYSMEDRTKRKINHSIQAWFVEPVSFLGLVIGLWVTRRQLWTESSVQHR